MNKIKSIILGVIAITTAVTTIALINLKTPKKEESETIKSYSYNQEKIENDEDTDEIKFIKNDEYDLNENGMLEVHTTVKNPPIAAYSVEKLKQSELKTNVEKCYQYNETNTEESMALSEIQEYSLDELTNISVNILIEDSITRPNQILLKLKNGDEIVEEALVNLYEDYVTFEFTNVLKYDSDGNEIDYMIEGEELQLYQLSINKIDNENFDIGYSIEYISDNMKLSGCAQFDSSPIALPDQIKVQLRGKDVYGNIIFSQLKTVDVYNSRGDYEFTDVPRYDSEGNEIFYTVIGSEVNEHYIPNVERLNIYYEYHEEIVDQIVLIRWNDNNNNLNKRPEQVMLVFTESFYNDNYNIDFFPERLVDVKSDGNDESLYIIGWPKYLPPVHDLEVLRVRVEEVNEDDLEFYSNSDHCFPYAGGGYAGGLRIEHHFQIPDTYTFIEPKVIWNDNSNNLYRPYYWNMRLYIYVNGEIYREQTCQYEADDTYGTNTIEFKKYNLETGEKNICTIDIARNGYRPDEFDFGLEDYIKTIDNQNFTITYSLINKIITSVSGTGGKILSGEEENPYEKVANKDNSTKDIVIIPDEGYKISNIQVNGEDIEFTPSEDGTYTLDKFYNVTEDKNVVAYFESLESSIVLKHQTEDGVDLVDPKIVSGTIGSKYTTTPIELDNYELKTTPENAKGTITEEQIEVVYVYSLVKGKITIIKSDKKDDTKLLSGAKFKIEKLDSSGNVDDTFIPLEKITDASGKIEFEELLVGKYRITETKAPEGYELRSVPIELEITKAEKQLNVIAKDNLKLVLPDAGGNGIKIYISIGITIIIISILLKRKLEYK